MVRLVIGWLAGRQAVCLSSLAGWSGWLLGRFGGDRAVGLAGREANGWWSRMVRLVVRLSA